MNIRFKKVIFPQDRDRLIRFLTSEEWPFHVNRHLEAPAVENMIDAGVFESSNYECHWILDTSNCEIGFLRLMDLDDVDDGSPLFDLRIQSAFRQRGIGREAVEWLAEYLFEKYPNLNRIEGTTRVDNAAMRNLFRSCFFVKEGHFRKDWPDEGGKVFDTVKYALLREDWKNKRLTPVNWDDEN